MTSTEKPQARMSAIATGFMWSGIAISVAEIWAGSLVGEAGLLWGLVIIVAGHLFGGLILSAGGCIGTKYRVTAMQSTRLVLGNRGSVLPSILNVLQLVGWATIMLALSGAIGAQVGEHLGGIFASRIFWIVIIGAGTLAWSLLIGDRRVQWIHAVVVSGLLILTAILSWVALNPRYYQLAGGLHSPVSLAGGMRLMDLVIAMPISWVPLIADYSRLAKSQRGAFWGSFIGYGIMSSWMYVIGLIVFLATGSADPASNIITLMGRIGLAVPAVILVFASTVTSDFPDIYSSACSVMNVSRRIKPVYTMWVTGILTILLAMAFDLSKYEVFLNAIGALFLPLFSILLVEYFLIRKQDLPGIDFSSGSGLSFTRGFHVLGLLVWALGSGVYFSAKAIDLPIGASIPSFILAGFLYWLVRTVQKRRHRI